MPGLDKALQISEALGVNIQWLSTGKGPKWASESQEEGARESSIDHSDDLYWSDSKSEQAIIDLLESTEKELNRVGQFPVTEAELNKNQILRDAKFQLSVLYSSPGMYPELKGQIELMLRLAFADPAIERSAADAMKKTHTRLKRASMLIETVSEAIGWEPPLDIKEAMKTAIFNDDLSEETVLRLMDAIYRAIQKGND
ncbi:Uncharacterised protein [Zhongshania aliphaticivorans]|nr:Uncharacterised protein [Zhongshania aliphaticivorans]